MYACILYVLNFQNLISAMMTPLYMKEYINSFNSKNIPLFLIPSDACLQTLFLRYDEMKMMFVSGLIRNQDLIKFNVKNLFLFKRLLL